MARVRRSFSKITSEDVELTVQLLFSEHGRCVTIRQVLAYLIPDLKGSSLPDGSTWATGESRAVRKRLDILVASNRVIQTMVNYHKCYQPNPNPETPVKKEFHPRPPDETIAERQQKVLALIKKGFNQKQIGERIGIDHGLVRHDVRMLRRQGKIPRERLQRSPCQSCSRWGTPNWESVCVPSCELRLEYAKEVSQYNLPEARQMSGDEGMEKREMGEIMAMKPPGVTEEEAPTVLLPFPPKEQPVAPQGRTLFIVDKRHRLIRKLDREGKTMEEIVDIVQVSKSTINKVLQKGRPRAKSKKKVGAPPRPGTPPAITELVDACCGEKIKCPDCQGEHYCMKKKGHDGVHYMVCPAGECPYPNASLLLPSILHAGPRKELPTEVPGPKPETNPGVEAMLKLYNLGYMFSLEGGETIKPYAPYDIPVPDEARFLATIREYNRDVVAYLASVPMETLREQAMARREKARKSQRGTVADYKERVARIKELDQAGKSTEEIMVEVGCSRTTVNRRRRLEPQDSRTGTPEPEPPKPATAAKLAQEDVEVAQTHSPRVGVCSFSHIPGAVKSGVKRPVGRPLGWRKEIIPEQPEQGFWAWIIRFAEQMMERRAQRRTQKAAKLVGMTPESMQALMKETRRMANDQG